MPHKDYQEFNALISTCQRKKIAVLLHSKIREYADDLIKDDELSRNEKLEDLFIKVLSHSQIEHPFIGETAHLDLVKNWNGAKSTVLAVATLSFLISRQDANDIVQPILEKVFSKEERNELNRIFSAASPKENDIRPFQILYRKGGIPEPEMIWVPTGSFLRGTQFEYDRDSFEGPRSEVTVHSAFGLGKHPVTVEEYRYFATASGRATKKVHVWNDQLSWQERNLTWESPGFSQTDDHPVVGVSYDDAIAYCRFLSNNGGYSYRLPSETEWEYCCRAGTETAYFWGDEMIQENAQFQRTRAYKQENVSEDYERATAPVKSFTPNPWGFYQMHGNVWELCADPWVDDYFHAPPHAGIRQVGDHSRAVIRGGCWLSIPNKLRSSKRDWEDRFRAGNTVGFRVACNLKSED